MSASIVNQFADHIMELASLPTQCQEIAIARVCSDHDIERGEDILAAADFGSRTSVGRCQSLDSERWLKRNLCWKTNRWKMALVWTPRSSEKTSRNWGAGFEELRGTHSVYVMIVALFLIQVGTDWTLRRAGSCTFEQWEPWESCQSGQWFLRHLRHREVSHESSISVLTLKRFGSWTWARSSEIHLENLDR